MVRLEGNIQKKKQKAYEFYSFFYVNPITNEFFFSFLKSSQGKKSRLQRIFTGLSPTKTWKYFFEREDKDKEKHANDELVIFSFFFLKNKFTSLQII